MQQEISLTEENVYREGLSSDEHLQTTPSMESVDSCVHQSLVCRLADHRCCSALHSPFEPSIESRRSPKT